jgi:hypothetical protein
MNLSAIRAIYAFEMARTRRTPLRGIVAPVVTTSSLYFVVFGAAIARALPSPDRAATKPESDADCVLGTEFIGVAPIRDYFFRPSL